MQKKRRVAVGKGQFIEVNEAVGGSEQQAYDNRVALNKQITKKSKLLKSYYKTYGLGSKAKAPKPKRRLRGRPSGGTVLSGRVDNILN